MNKLRVLFVCVHNSARSQMAEALLRHVAGDRVEVESAGLEPGELNPLAIDAMALIGIDIRRNATKSVGELLAAGITFTHIVTVCDPEAAERCPVFPGRTTRMHWPLPDPSTFEGAYSDKLARTVELRNEIDRRVRRWLEDAIWLDENEPARG